MRMNDVDLETNSFFITNEGFFSKKEKITKKTIIQYNLPKSILREYIEEKVFNITVLKKKIKRFIFKYVKRCKNK